MEDAAEGADERIRVALVWLLEFVRQGKQALLPLYHGQDVQNAVASWSADQGLSEEDTQALVGAIVQRLAPTPEGNGT